VNAGRWQCDLRASRSARVLNVTLFGLGGALLLSCRWPAGWAWVQIAVVILLTLQYWRNARRLQQRCGALMLDDKGDWYWRGERWQAQRTPDWLPWGVLLVLRNRRGQRWRLWLLHDSMPPDAWRALRARCFLLDGATPH